MFIKGSPRMEAALPRLNDPTSATAFSPWACQLNQINPAALVLSQQGLHDMSFSPMFLINSGWAHAQPSALKPDPEEQSYPAHGRGYYPEPRPGGDGDAPPSASTSGDRNTQHMPSSAYVSHFPTPTEPRAALYHASANATPGTEPLESAYWQVAPPGTRGTPAVPPPCAPYGGGDPMWQQHPPQGASGPMLGYGHYSLGARAGVLSHTVFRHGEMLPDLPLAQIPADDAVATNSKLYASSGMLEAMVLSDEPVPSPWNVSPSAVRPGYDGPCRIDVPELPGGAWAEASQTAGEQTVSPKMLRIRPSLTPSSSSESLGANFLAREASTGLPAAPVPVLRSQASKPPKRRASTRASRLLPNRGHQRATLQSSDMSSRRQRAARPNPPSPVPRRLTRLRPKQQLAQAQAQAQAQAPAAAPAAAPAPAPALPPPPPVFPHQQTNTTAITAPNPSGRGCVDLRDRAAKDDFLVRHKQMGMPYREIRRLGGFTEAESTLRGRYRTLTKSREARVRKPEWSEKDLRLLERGVRHLAHTPDLNPAKVPWKRVAEYIVEHGGSYHFGNSTCRKRWDELVREQAALGKGVQQRFFEETADDDADADADAGAGTGARVCGEDDGHGPRYGGDGDAREDTRELRERGGFGRGYGRSQTERHGRRRGY